MKTPDELYTKSERKYTGDYDELEYPIGFLVRKVTGGGEIILNGVRITIGYALRGWHVGLKPLDDRQVRVQHIGKWRSSTHR